MALFIIDNDMHHGFRSKVSWHWRLMFTVCHQSSQCGLINWLVQSLSIICLHKLSWLGVTWAGRKSQSALVWNGTAMLTLQSSTLMRTRLMGMTCSLLREALMFLKWHGLGLSRLCTAVLRQGRPAWKGHSTAWKGHSTAFLGDTHCLIVCQSLQGEPDLQNKETILWRDQMLV